jgi:hypothetical protein
MELGSEQEQDTSLMLNYERKANGATNEFLHMHQEANNQLQYKALT